MLSTNTWEKLAHFIHPLDNSCEQRDLGTLCNISAGPRSGTASELQMGNHCSSLLEGSSPQSGITHLGQSFLDGGGNRIGPSSPQTGKICGQVHPDISHARLVSITLGEGSFPAALHLLEVSLRGGVGPRLKYFFRSPRSDSDVQPELKIPVLVAGNIPGVP